MLQDNSFPGVCIIVVNWNNPTDTIDCLRSVYKLDYPCLDVIVVDNGSNDDSVERIRQEYPIVKIMETGKNLGYAGGHNHALKTALLGESRFFLLLNNDTILADDLVSQLSKSLMDHPEACFVAPMILEYDTPEHIFSLGCLLDIKKADGIRLHAGEHKDACNWGSEQVDFADGSALFFDRCLVDAIGMMDEEYFLYFEETDWSVRARKAGFKVVTVPSARMWHKVSATMKKASPIVTYYMTRNSLRLIKQNLPFWSSIQSQAYVVLRCFWWILSDLRQGNKQHAVSRLEGLHDFFRSTFGPYRGTRFQLKS
jgi:GT2 family glycosyltransferase